MVNALLDLTEPVLFELNDFSCVPLFHFNLSLSQGLVFVHVVVVLLLEEVDFA